MAAAAPENRMNQLLHKLAEVSAAMLGAEAIAKAYSMSSHLLKSDRSLGGRAEQDEFLGRNSQNPEERAIQVRNRAIFKG